MLRIILYVAALICLFGGTIVYGGNALGAWDPIPPAPQPPPAVELDRAKDKQVPKKHKARSQSASRTATGSA